MKQRSTSRRVKTGNSNRAIPGALEARDRIFAAASQLIRERGASAATTRAICTAAGITAPTLYHHFGDIDKLYTKVLEALFLEYLAEGPPDEQNPMEMIDDVWRRSLRIARDQPGVIDLVNHQLSTGRIPTIMRNTQGRLRAAFERLAEMTPMRVKPRVAAHMFWATAHGLTCLIVASRHGVPLPQGVAATLKAALLQAILEQPPAALATRAKARQRAGKNIPSQTADAPTVEVE